MDLICLLFSNEKKKTRVHPKVIVKKNKLLTKEPYTLSQDACVNNHVNYIVTKFLFFFKDSGKLDIHVNLDFHSQS